MITYFQAIIIGLLQGITELFPISSLGHSVLLSSLLGWNNLVAAQSKNESFFLSLLVAFHLATALALLVFYRKEWVKIIGGFFTSVSKRRVGSPYERLAWLLIIATIPAGLTGLVFEHTLRTQFAKPSAAAVFLIINGLILFVGDRALKKLAARRDFSLDTTTENTSKLGFKRAVLIGVAQVFALLAGISRSGITMVSGLYSGLDYEDSARFSFLLATPIILAAGMYKLPDLLGSNASGSRGQIIVGALVAGVAAYLSVSFLDKYFRKQSLRPFAYYCIAFGLFMLVLQLLRR